ncbi:hypothetical protein FWK35_00006086 [Aphis craccivora]|uniref:Uncharacterized protein n=1 Tax=Aphis craccivora TaxID=307492 RepID=A0A6G0ZAV3_APHCR|nr:hypothetical protein FWK35_00006086 [Aphis craccivora]
MNICKLFCSLKFNTKFSISLAYNNYKRKLNLVVFRPLKHKSPFSPSTGNYILG